MLLRFALSAPARMGASISRLPNLQSGLKQTIFTPHTQQYKFGLRNTQVRNYARGPRDRVIRSEVESKPTLKERLMAPPSENAYGIGKGAVAGAAVVGLGALCFYGAGLGKGTSAYDQSILWPKYVKERIQSTYGYFGASCAVTAASAMAVFNSPRLLNLAMRNGWMSVFATMALVIGSGVLTQSIPYQENSFGAKQLAWLAHCAILGAVIAPMCFLGGPVLTRAALYTGGIVGGLSTVAVCAPSDKFLYMGGPLAVGLGLVFASSLASMWLPPTTAVGAGLASMSLYGGLILFGGFLLYDTQRIIRKAEGYPVYAPRPYDPVNASLAIYMDAINIFIRMAMILGGGGGNQRRK